MEQPSQSNLFDLPLNQPAINYLSETARWARLLSIIGFIWCGLMATIGLFSGSMMSRMMNAMGGETAMPTFSGVFLGFIFILASLILFFPAYYLFIFSSKMRIAVRNNDPIQLAESFKNLKSFFKFYGIFVIIFLSFYALLIGASLIGTMLGTRH